MLRRLRPSPTWIDALGCGVLLIVAQSQVWLNWADGGVGESLHGHRLARSAVAVATVAPLAWRRSRPLPVVTVICAAMVCQLLIVTPSLPFLGALLPMAIANYTAAAYAPRWPVASLAVVFATEAVIAARIPEERTQSELLFSVFVILGTWLAGDMVRGRLARADRAVNLARRLVGNQAAAAAAALADERRRIARELHDVIAHSVSVMGVQAGAARTMIDGHDPAAAREAVLAIESTARSSVAELQRLLEVLRDDEATVEGRHPQPGLSTLDTLVGQVRAAGLPITVSAGPVPPLPPGLDLVAYRVLQESLTNALKHATSPTTVRIRFRNQQLSLEIGNAGPIPDGGRPGHGLIGMRERVQLYGGTLHTGPTEAGGFLVRATLPVEVPG